MTNNDRIETLDALGSISNLIHANCNNLPSKDYPSDPIVQSVDINTKSSSYVGAAGASTMAQPQVNFNFRPLVADPVFNGINISIPRKVVEKVSARLEHTLYGYFIGKRLTFPLLNTMLKTTGADLVDSVTVGIPSLKGDDFTKETIHVEYEWRPPRCDECKIFCHVHDHFPKKMVSPPIVTTSNVVAPTVEKSNDGFQMVGKKRRVEVNPSLLMVVRFTGPFVKQTVRYEPKATTSAPKKGATNVSNPSKSSSMLKTADTSLKNDDFTTSNSFFSLNDEEEDDEEVENMYDELANLVPNKNTGGSSSFTAVAGNIASCLLYRFTRALFTSTMTIHASIIESSLEIVNMLRRYEFNASTSTKADVEYTLKMMSMSMVNFL
ncbi:hypothetical protein Tco_0576215 [Tanacetum coccineum]